MDEPVRLSLKLKEIPLLLEGPDGVERRFAVRELDGMNRDKFTDAMDKRQVKDSTGKVVGFKDHKNVLSNLLALTIVDEHGTAVDERVIQKWPTSTQVELVKMAAGLSGLGDGLEKAQEEAKND